MVPVMIRTLLLACAMMMALTPLNASAEFAKISNQTEFLRYVAGKTLTRPLVELRVTSDGRIEGTGARWEVTGKWSWQNGFFCRSLFWGGDDMGYNCQEVRVKDGRLRFTSDKGAGMSAVFRLRD
jgi:hypothetical protein